MLELEDGDGSSEADGDFDDDARTESDFDSAADSDFGSDLDGSLDGDFDSAADSDFGSDLDGSLDGDFDSAVDSDFESDGPAQDFEADLTATPEPDYDPRKRARIRNGTRQSQRICPWTQAGMRSTALPRPVSPWRRRLRLRQPEGGERKPHRSASAGS